MKRCSFVVVLLFVIAGFALSPSGSGWAPLFNGKDLSGWKKNGDEKWVVDQGTANVYSCAARGDRATGWWTYRSVTDGPS